MISNLALKYEGFNPKVGSTYNFSGLNPSIEDSEDGHFLKITPLYEPLRARKVKFLHLKSADSFTKCIIETQNVVNIFLKR